MSLKAAAQYLADHGRHGDTMLVHMTKEEVQGLQQLAEMHGLSLTINPHTGLPEAFSLKSLLKAVAPIALGAFLGPGAFGITGMGLSAGTAGLITGGITSALTGSLEKGIMAGLGAYGGAGMAEGAKSLGEASLSTADQSAAETARLLGKEAAAQGATAVPSELSTQFAEAYAPGTTQSAAETSRLLGREAIAAAPEEAMKNIAARNASEFAVANSNVVSPFTSEQAVQEGLRQAVKDPSALYKAMGPDAMQYTAAAGLPAAQELSRRKMPDVPKYTPTAAIHPKYAYRDQEGNVQFVDLPGVKMEDWKPEQSISDYVRSLVAEPTYEDEIKRAAQGGLMDDQDLVYQNDPVVRMADGGYTSKDIQDYLAANPGMSDTQIAAAMDQYKVTPAQMAAATGLSLDAVQGRYNAAEQNIAGIQNAFQNNYATASAGDIDKYIQGVGGIANMQAALQAGNMQDVYGTSGGGTPFTSAADLYQLQTGGSFAPISSSINKWLDERLGTYTTPQAAAAARAQAEQAMVEAGMNEWDVLKATGKTLDQLYGVTPSTKVALPGGGVGTNMTYTGDVSTTPQTYAPEGTTNPYGNAINPGDITRNLDGTLTVTPNIPGRPYGGFTGMGQVRDAYTAGGGKLGQVLRPTKDYQNTGLSAAAYDYLMGKGAWPTYTQKPPIAANSFKDITNPTKAELLTYKGKSKVWQDGKMIDNPYVSGEKEGEKKTDTAVTTPTYDGGGGGGDKRGGLIAAYAAGGMSGGGYDLGGYSDGGRLLRGPGDGVSDSIPATIGGKRPARLADGEFVVPARIVSEIGNGSTEAGARKLYAMMERVQQARKETVGKGRSKVAKNTRADKYLPV